LPLVRREPACRSTWLLKEKSFAATIMNSTPEPEQPSPFISPFGSPTFREPRGRVIALIGYQATLYFEHGTSAPAQHAVRDCLDLFLFTAQPHLRWMTNRAGNQWERFEVARINSFRDSLREAAETNWEMRLHAARQPDEASEFQFGVYARTPRSGPLSYLRFAMPMGDPKLASEPFGALVQQCCDLLHPFHGYGGFTFLESSDLGVKSMAQPLICSLAHRFPGIDVDRPLVHLLRVAKGIKGVNWLTFLGAHWVGEAGGRATLQAALPDAFVFHDCGGGLLIQAGSRPQMGDRNQKLWVTLYPELSRLLKPIRVQKHRPLDFAGRNRFDEQKTEEWLSRFDHDPW
jgi:Protein of unknown function (DUF3396)